MMLHVSPLELVGTTFLFAGMGTAAPRAAKAPTMLFIWSPVTKRGCTHDLRRRELLKKKLKNKPKKSSEGMGNCNFTCAIFSNPKAAESPEIVAGDRADIFISIGPDYWAWIGRVGPHTLLHGWISNAMPNLVTQLLPLWSCNGRSVKQNEWKLAPLTEQIKSAALMQADFNTIPRRSETQTALDWRNNVAWTEQAQLSALWIVHALRAGYNSRNTGQSSSFLRVKSRD